MAGKSTQLIVYVFARLTKKTVLMHKKAINKFLLA